jgi:hypothetical protein
VSDRIAFWAACLLAAVVVGVFLAVLVTARVAVYRECRAAGFSPMYCRR